MKSTSQLFYVAVSVVAVRTRGGDPPCGFPKRVLTRANTFSRPAQNGRASILVAFVNADARSALGESYFNEKGIMSRFGVAPTR
jgi:hypothetical protein